MLPVLRTEQAETELARILEYLEERNSAAARKLARTIDECCARLGQFPQMGRTRDELAKGIRSIVVGRYLLFYRITLTAIEVIHILHTAQDIESIFKAGQ